MSLIERIPELSDAELANLGANAARLEQSGTPRQQTDAAALLPVVNAELARRKEAAAAARAARKPPPKAKVAKVAKPKAAKKAKVAATADS